MLDLEEDETFYAEEAIREDAKANETPSLASGGGTVASASSSPEPPSPKSIASETRKRLNDGSLEAKESTKRPRLSLNLEEEDEGLLFMLQVHSDMPI